MLNILFDIEEIRLELTPMPPSPAKPGVDEVPAETTISDADEELLTTIVEHNPSVAYAARNGLSLNPVNVALELFSPSHRLGSSLAVSRDVRSTSHLHITQEEVKPRRQDEQGTGGLDPPRLPPINGWTDPRLPYLVSLWLQLFVNIVIVAVAIGSAYYFVRGVASDVKHKRAQQIASLFQHKLTCGAHYERNLCGTLQMPPVLEQKCQKWKRGMDSDPYAEVVGFSATLALTLADIINHFVRPLLWKAIVVVPLLAITVIVVLNVSFNQYRRLLDRDLSVIKSF